MTGGVATTLLGEGLQMLKGFTVPRSPLGMAALTPSPPWHYAGDVLAVEFWNDPDVSADILPGGVKLDALCWGRSVALFADCQFTANSDEYLDPARYQSREFIVLLDELVQCLIDNLLITNLWVGEGELTFPEAYGEELDILGPIKVGRGFRFSFSCSISDCTIRADLTV